MVSRFAIGASNTSDSAVTNNENRDEGREAEEDRTWKELKHRLVTSKFITNAGVNHTAAEFLSEQRAATGKDAMTMEQVIKGLKDDEAERRVYRGGSFSLSKQLSESISSLDFEFLSSSNDSLHRSFGTGSKHSSGSSGQQHDSFPELRNVDIKSAIMTQGETFAPTAPPAKRRVSLPKMMRRGRDCPLDGQKEKMAASRISTFVAESDYRLSSTKDNDNDERAASRCSRPSLARLETLGKKTLKKLATAWSKEDGEDLSNDEEDEGQRPAKRHGSPPMRVPHDQQTPAIKTATCGVATEWEDHASQETQEENITRRTSSSNRTFFTRESFNTLNKETLRKLATGWLEDDGEDLSDDEKDDEREHHNYTGVPALTRAVSTTDLSSFGDGASDSFNSSVSSKSTNDEFLEDFRLRPHIVQGWI